MPRYRYHIHRAVERDSELKYTERSPRARAENNNTYIHRLTGMATERARTHTHTHKQTLRDKSRGHAQDIPTLRDTHRTHIPPHPSGIQLWEHLDMQHPNILGYV